MLVVVIAWSGASRAVFSQPILRPRFQPFGPIADQAEPELSPSTIDVAKKTENELFRAAKVLSTGQWEAAVETFRTQMETEGRQLIARDASEHLATNEFETFVPVRTLCQRRLAELVAGAPQALSLYRSRVDTLAERWYKQGLEQRDENMLRRVVDQFFVSSFGDDAAFRLGEYYLQRREYTAARACWESISPRLRAPASGTEHYHPRFGDPLWLALRRVDLAAEWEQIEPILTAPYPAPVWSAYPDTSIPLADVRARLALVSVLEGDLERAEVEINLLERLHPEAAGRLAGEEAPYAATLKKLAAESEAWPPTEPLENWPTFAGNQQRDGGGSHDVDPVGRPLWSFRWPTENAGNDRIGFGRIRPAEGRYRAEESAGLLSYHPVVADTPRGKVVLIQEMTRVSALALHTGKAVWGDSPRFSSTEVSTSIEDDRDHHFPQRRNRALAGVPRYTLNAHAGKLIARMGSPLTAIRREGGNPTEKYRSVVRILDLSGAAASLPDIQTEGPDWAFDGTPVTDGVNVYAVLRHAAAQDPNVTLHVAAYDINTCERKWRRWICTATTTAGANTDELTHTLLTLSEGTLYLNTNLGVVAALSTDDGGFHWATRYPRANPPTGSDINDQYRFRDLTPCLVHQGQVIVAAADCDRLFSLDATTGLLRWETAPGAMADVVHLLGVGHNELLASGDSLYWINIEQGRLSAAFPTISNDLGHVRPDPPGYGRGVLAGEHVYWPTRDEIYVFDQQIHDRFSPTLRRRIDLSQGGLLPGNLPEQSSPPERLQGFQSGVVGGNLLVVDGILLIAGPNGLTAFAQ